MNFIIPKHKKHQFCLQTGTKTVNNNQLKKWINNNHPEQLDCVICGSKNGKRVKTKKGYRYIWNVLDHINGNSRDNRLENVRGACPNCNSTLPTTCTNKSKIQIEWTDEYFEKILKTMWTMDGFPSIKGALSVMTSINAHSYSPKVTVWLKKHHLPVWWKGRYVMDDTYGWCPRGEKLFLHIEKKLRKESKHPDTFKVHRLSER